MAKIGIFLDDERNVEDVTWMQYDKDIDWVVVRRVSDFMFAIMHMGEEDFIISFDHDLQDFHFYTGKEQTGYDALRWYINYCFESGIVVKKCFFHTQNPIGKKNMESYYNNAVKFQQGEQDGEH